MDIRGWPAGGDFGDCTSHGGRVGKTVRRSGGKCRHAPLGGGARSRRHGGAWRALRHPVVGAGRIGQELYSVISFNYYQEIGAIIVLIIAAVSLIDLTSERLRTVAIGRVE